MSNANILLDGDQIFVDELIRENARLIIQHEADQQVIQDLQRRASSEELEGELGALKKDYDYIKHNAEQLDANLKQAISDLRFVMSGRDACKICARKCSFGENDCDPVWRGERTDDINE